ncbi:hypothetical protein SAMD00023353_0401010 [Rosellinia necatrix]|uniref:Uncharacterized protein n=1 Tax=Rosellinia necatrix TaxID=77044 RepID=A0A1S7UIR1_ROSNE|nr:hypothetical protein SAMD00023353_0401010 [Rosellinia necatrix]
MASRITRLCLLAGYLAIRASAACTVYGVDYSNGGSYNIDTSSDALFTFTSVFQGCTQEAVKPVLVDPAGHQYTCGAINTTPDGEEEKSTCSIAYSSMFSGQWKIIISGTGVAVQRVINLTSVAPSTVIVTATPTVTVGITSTPKATTVFSTVGTQTQTLILAPATITTPCSGSTTTVTVSPTKATVIQTSVVIRTTTDSTTTKHSTTTTTKTAYCHYTSQRPTGTICIGNSCGLPPDLPAPTICVGVYCPRPATETAGAADTVINDVQEVVKVVMATTITVTETTYTVTSTSVTVLPTPTTTENVIKTVTATVHTYCRCPLPTDIERRTPPPSIVCSGQKPGATVSITKPQATVTQTSLSYSTSHVTGTVTAIETKTTVTTNSKSATSCWINGGWMGAD